MFDIVSVVLVADLDASGTKTLSYPAGRSKGSYAGATGHTAFALQSNLRAPADFTLTFNASNITFTLGAGRTTIPSGETLSVQLERQGEDDGRPLDTAPGVVLAPLTYVNLGSPITADDDALIKAATGSEIPDAAETVTYTFPAESASPQDGTNLTGVLDVPRNVTTKVTHASAIVAMTVTYTGTRLGHVQTETHSVTATGTSKTVAGTKAFDSITKVEITAAADASANTLNIGFADVLGLPVALPSTGMIVGEMEDGAVPTAGTAVAAVASAATATTGDVCGTYDPNSAADGTKGFALLIALPDPTYRGVTPA